MLAKLIVALGYAWTLFNMAAVTSIRYPQNIPAWFTNHEVWLYPELQRAWGIITEAEVPYQEEQELLESRDD